MKIKISSKAQKLIYENQKKDFEGVVPPRWGYEGQVKDHFTSKNNNAVDRFKKLAELIPLNKKMKILDLGCGYGFLVIVLGKLGFKVFGCDNDLGSIAIAKMILKENGLNPNLIIKNGDRLPYKDETFDLIYLNHVLVYVKNLPVFFKEIKRVLKKTGRVYLVTPNYQCCYDINYGVFLIPWLPRNLNKLYLRFLGRKASFLDSLSFTTKKMLENIFKESDFKFKNVGLQDWIGLFDEEKFNKRSPYLKKFIFFIRRFHLKPILSLLANKGFYTPLVYILGKSKSEV